MARLESQNERNALRAAQANLAAAEGQLTQARNSFARPRRSSRLTTRPITISRRRRSKPRNRAVDAAEAAAESRA